MPHFPFQRLQADLAALIAKLPADSRLPSEPDLAAQLGVSRATLREAMRTFETQGLIRRRQGAGTFVVGKVPVLESGLEVLESINTPGDGPDRAQQQSQAKTLINDYVALYRPNRSVNGLASFTTMQTALNSLAGNYVSYANRPLPEALQQRISKELHQAQTTAVRGS